MSENNEFEIIHRYTRQQAIDDGMLVEVPEDLLKNAGIKFPVAVTATVWHEYIEVPEGLEGEQDLTGRLWDVLWMFRNKAKGSPQSTILFEVLFIMIRDGKRVQETVTLKSVIGPGDNGEPVITIMVKWRIKE